MRVIIIVLVAVFLMSESVFGLSKDEKREKEMQDLQEQFTWWPTDATPGPVKDEERGGYYGSGEHAQAVALAITAANEDITRREQNDRHSVQRGVEMWKLVDG